MNKYLTNKTRLFSYNTLLSKRSHKETSTPFACFVTPSAPKPMLFLLLECPYASQSTIPKCLSSLDKSCATYVISSQSNSAGAPKTPTSRLLIGL